MDKSYFLKRAHEIHGNEYTYEKVTDNIKSNKDKVELKVAHATVIITVTAAIVRIPTTAI